MKTSIDISTAYTDTVLFQAYSVISNIKSG